MKTAFASLLPLLALAGCATTGGQDETSYRALGTEPFWSISIENGLMTYDSPDERFSVPAAAARETGDGRIYRTRRITLHAWLEECSDGMSDRLYAETVRAEVDGRALDGCGGAILPPLDLEGTSWSIVEIGGEAVSGEAYSLRFANGDLSGQAGCNRFSGGYTLSGETLTPGAIAATRMACPGPRMAHEQRAFAILSGPVTMLHPDGDTLVLTGADGEDIRLRRAH